MSEEIVIIGGGYAGLQAALYFHKAGHRCTLIDKNSGHELLPELPYRITDHDLKTSIPFSELIGGKSVNFLQGEVNGINYQSKKISLKNGQTINFDYLILALGSQTNYFNIPGLQEHSLGFISTAQAERVNHTLENNLEKARSAQPGSEEYRELMSVIVGGGGLTGVEVAGEMIYSLPKLAKAKGLNPNDLKIYLIEAMDTLMPVGDKELSAKVTNFFKEQKLVELLLSSPIKEAFPGGVKVGEDRIIKAKTVLWTGGIRANAFFENPFIGTDGNEAKWALGRGFRLEVDDFYRVKGVPKTYAIGDNALIMNPETKTPFALNGQAAYKQGRAVVEYVLADMKQSSIKPKEIKLEGVLVSLGPKVGTGTIWSPIKAPLPVSRLSKKIKDLVEFRYRQFDIRK